MDLSLWSAGSNARGQLAHGDDEDAHRLEPALFEIGGVEQTTLPGRITQIACGANHTLAIIESDSERLIWGVGDNSKGQLGISQSTQEFHTFRPLNLGVQNQGKEGKETVEMVQAAWETSFTVLRSAKEDRIISFGSNDFGLLGDGLSVSDTPETARQVTLDCLGTSGLKDFCPQVTHFKSGPRHALAVISYEVSGERRDTLIGWGACRHHELEIRDPKEENKPPSKGTRFSSKPIAINTWKNPQKVADLAVGQQHALVLLNDGQVVMLGSNAKCQLPSAEGSSLDSQICRVYCSWNNSLVASGTILPPSIDSLWSYGRNLHGQLGRSEETGVAQNQIRFPVHLAIRNAVCGSEHCLIMCKSPPE